MSTPISISITADSVAWYGAVVSSIGIIIAGRIAWRDRARLRISLQKDMSVINVPGFDKTKKYIDITVRNTGRRPLKLSLCWVRPYGKKISLVILENSRIGSDVLTEENPRANYFLEQSMFPIKFHEIYSIYISDESGKKHVYYPSRLPTLMNFIYPIWYMTFGRNGALK